VLHRPVFFSGRKTWTIGATECVGISHDGCVGGGENPRVVSRQKRGEKTGTFRRGRGEMQKTYRENVSGKKKKKKKKKKRGPPHAMQKILDVRERTGASFAERGFRQSLSALLASWSKRLLSGRSGKVALLPF